MSRKQYKGPAHSHEKKLTKKERQAQAREQMTPLPQEEVIPTEEDTVQVKNLMIILGIGIALLTALMYYIFMNS